MLRTTTFLLALLMASGPVGTSALCRIWCDRQLAVEEVCHEPGMTGNGIGASIDVGGESACRWIGEDGAARTEERQTKGDAARSFIFSTITLAGPLLSEVPRPTAVRPAAPTGAPPLVSVLRL